MHEWLTEVASWAWDRHHDILSWYIRPLFLLPFCCFAYRRNVVGIVVIVGTLIALVTSMAWFPSPAQPDPAVVQMLEAERDYLLGEWTLGKIVIALLVPVVFGGIGVARWRHSIGWALVVINAAMCSRSPGRTSSTPRARAPTPTCPPRSVWRSWTSCWCSPSVGCDGAPSRSGSADMGALVGVFRDRPP
jgi:hypothetical protein